MHPVYLKQHIKAVDHEAARSLDIGSFELMYKAASAVFSYIRRHKNILVVTGIGHNAGDGLIIAALALNSGINVEVWNLKPVEELPEDAQKAAKAYQQAGGEFIKRPSDQPYDCIVDAILGTGLNREVKGHFAKAIDWINNQHIKTIAVDIPSGLDADTGVIRSSAIQADITICIICFKPGLLTHYGKDMCGQVYLEDLDIPKNLQKTIKTSIHLLDKTVLNHPKLTHPHNSHKNSFGQVLIAGGKENMLGALILAGQAALRSGCGLVEVVSQYKQPVLISLQCPELLTGHDIKTARLITSADVIAIGPGLGLDSDAKSTLKYCLKQKKPMVIDADALTLIAQQYHFDNTSIQSVQFNDNVVLTPHPKEAARLLNCDTQTIQKDRIGAARALSKRYNANIILKGSGSIICDTTGQIFICPFGYSGMATAGMGDVLTGMIAGLIAQGMAAIEAAKTATLWHAVAAENCQKGNSLIASDVIHQLPATLSL